MTVDSTVTTAIAKVILLRCTCAEHLKSEKKIVYLSQMKIYSHRKDFIYHVNASTLSLMKLSEINILKHKQTK